MTDALPSNNKIQELDKASWYESNNRIYHCHNKICNFKYDFQPSDKIVRSVAKKSKTLTFHLAIFL